MSDAVPPTDLPELHSRALLLCGESFALITQDAVAADALDAPTPCGEWTLRDLTNHVVSENFWVGPLVAGRTIDEVGDRFDGDLVGSDPAAAYVRSAAEASAAFFGPEAMTTPVAVSYGPIPGSELCAHRLLDLVVHGWDVVQSIGAAYSVPNDLVAAVTAIIEADRTMLRESGLFGTEIEVDADADAWTRVLAAVGRQG